MDGDGIDWWHGATSEQMDEETRVVTKASERSVDKTHGRQIYRRLNE